MARFRTRSTRPRRPTKWCAHFLSNSLGTIADPSNWMENICTEAQLSAFTSPTIVRIRGQVRVNLTVPDIDGAQGIHYILAIALVDKNLTSIGDLFADANADGDFMWSHYGGVSYDNHEQIRFTDTGALAGATTKYLPGGEQYERINVDVKAMRRVGGDKKLVMIGTFYTLNGDPGGLTSAFLRTLVKE